MSNNNFGVITEQGDMGLGFNSLSESQVEQIEKAQKENDNEYQKETKTNE